MKTFSILLILACCINAYAQDKTFTIEGKTVNDEGLPIADVYVVNPRTLEKDITRKNGIFSIEVSPTDSLIFSHISFFRTSVQVYKLLMNPLVTLESEDVKIPEILVRPNQKTDLERARQNLKFLDDYKPLKYNKMKPETDPTTAIITEHNRLMRTEAGSISLLPILDVPATLIEKAIKKRKKRKLYRSYYSTRKRKEVPAKTEKNKKD